MPEVIKHEEDTTHHMWWVRLERRRTAFLTIRKGSHPLRADAGSCAGCLSTDEETSSVREAADWLLTRVGPDGGPKAA